MDKMLQKAGFEDNNTMRTYTINEKRYKICIKNLKLVLQNYQTCCIVK